MEQHSFQANNIPTGCENDPNKNLEQLKYYDLESWGNAATYRCDVPTFSEKFADVVLRHRRFQVSDIDLFIVGRAPRHGTRLIFGSKNVVQVLGLDRKYFYENRVFRIWPLNANLTVSRANYEENERLSKIKRAVFSLMCFRKGTLMTVDCKGLLKRDSKNVDRFRAMDIPLSPTETTPLP